MSKVIIAGSREFDRYEDVALVGDVLINEGDVVVSGGARGADTLGERYARERGLQCLVMKADWDVLGKRAGYVRNRDMAIVSDMLIAFWDGKSKGTKHMIDLALEKGLKVFVYPTVRT
jgi:predicted Rossmann fold nucleotide-binding protein DprA/Smf involved in DNA uptake